MSVCEERFCDEEAEFVVGTGIEERKEVCIQHARAHFHMGQTVRSMGDEFDRESVSRDAVYVEESER